MTQGVRGTAERGTRSCYILKCDHPECRKAHAEYMREYRAVRKFLETRRD